MYERRGEYTEGILKGFPKWNSKRGQSQVESWHNIQQRIIPGYNMNPDTGHIRLMVAADRQAYDGGFVMWQPAGFLCVCVCGGGGGGRAAYLLPTCWFACPPHACLPARRPGTSRQAGRQPGSQRGGEAGRQAGRRHAGRQAGRQWPTCMLVEAWNKLLL